MSEQDNDNWQAIEVGRFVDDMNAEQALCLNINSRFYRKQGDSYVVYEFQRCISRTICPKQCLQNVICYA